MHYQNLGLDYQTFHGPEMKIFVLLINGPVKCWNLLDLMMQGSPFFNTRDWFRWINISSQYLIYRVNFLFNIIYPFNIWLDGFRWLAISSQYLLQSSIFNIWSLPCSDPIPDWFNLQIKDGGGLHWHKSFGKTGEIFWALQLQFCITAASSISWLETTTTHKICGFKHFEIIAWVSQDSLFIEENNR